mmetsp:Transcript_5625/g.23831  ORF Transcript_5625/g.23831 Transcript_5625/m.23831 type:complete len:212 (+) Transcript_5625:861-1496(+)
MPIRCSFTIESASTECTPLVSCVRSTPLRWSISSSRGGSMSTFRVRNFCRMLAYITSCTPLRRSAARIAWMRRNSTNPPSAPPGASDLVLDSPSSAVTSTEPCLCSSASSSSDMRSSVASTAAVNRCDSLSSTCASIWPCALPGSIGAPANVGGAGNASSDASPPAARATQREARKRRARAARPENTRRGARPGLEGGVDAAKDARAGTRR